METTKGTLYVIGEGGIWVGFPILVTQVTTCLTTQGAIVDPAEVWRTGANYINTRMPEVWTCRTDGGSAVCVLMSSRYTPIAVVRQMCEMLDMPTITKRIIDDEIPF